MNSPKRRSTTILIDSLLRLLRHSRAEVAAMLGNRLLDRQLYKVIEVFDDSAFQQAQQKDHEIKFKDRTLEYR